MKENLKDMEVCRLCLTMTNTNEVLNNQELIGRIKECVSIEISINENFSKEVCDICLRKVDNWYDFKIMCLKSKSILENNQIESLEPFDKQDFELNTTEQDYRTRRNSVIINRRNIPVNTELSTEWGDKFPGNSQEDSNIPFMHLDNVKQTDENDISEAISEIKQIPIHEENGMKAQIYSCEFCNQSFEYYTDYLDHQNDHNGEAVFHCSKCEMTFSNKTELVKHEKAHKIACDICGTLVQKQSLKLHLNKHTDKFKCTHCSLTFTCAPLLRDHITARHMKLKLHFCDVCGKDFATKSSLVLHLKTHSEERQYKCEKCDYAGRTSISLRIHMSKHENNTCICEYCSKIFKSNRNLNDHLKRVHCSEKKHSCDFCGMKFALRYLVEQHKRTHTGIHPYKCTKCSKTFARSDGLREHMKTHNRTEMFICPMCSKEFLTVRGIKRHICVASKIVIGM